MNNFELHPDLGSIAPSPKVQVVTKISKWDKYEYCEMDNMKWIKGSSPNNPNTEKFEFMEVDTPNILYALLDLHSKLKTPFSFNHKYISEHYNPDDTPRIIKFCKKYGLPQWGLTMANYCINDDTIRRDDIATNTILRPIVPFATENYLHIPSLICALQLLKTDFLRIVAVKGWDTLASVTCMLSDDDKKRLRDIKLNQKTSDFSKHLYLPNLNPFTTYFDSDTMRLRLHCENLLHVSVYYLCVLLQSSQFFGGYIKQCKMCGSLFVTSQSRQQFCFNPCSRQSYYSMKKRLNKDK